MLAKTRKRWLIPALIGAMVGAAIAGSTLWSRMRPLVEAVRAFTGDARWLQIAVKCMSDANYTMLAPRQALTPVPYALALLWVWRNLWRFAATWA